VENRQATRGDRDRLWISQGGVIPRRRHLSTETAGLST
jgi:hypothetical protein